MGAAIGAVMGCVIALMTKEWWLIGVSTGIGAGMGVANNPKSGLGVGAVVGVVVGLIAAGVTKEWWLFGASIGIGFGVGPVMGMCFGGNKE